METGNPVLSSPMEGNPDCLALPRSAQHHMPSTHFPTFTVMAAVVRKLKHGDSQQRAN